MFTEKSISRIFSVLFVFVFILAVTPLQAAHAAGVRYAKPIASGTGDCSSWANVCTLQTALTGAVSGDEIWAAAGVYKPTAGTDRTATFQLKDGVALYGGFAGTETARSQRNPAAHVTILSGDLNGDDNSNVKYDEPTRADNSYHVVIGATGATLDGFAITAGNANGDYPNDNGGGMYNSTSNPTLTNVTFSSNSASNDGGGMYNSNGSPALTNVTFSDNSIHDWGGGMYNYGGSPALTNVTFSNNSTVFEYGGGMYNGNSSSTLTNVTFSSNSAPVGGGMFNDNSSSTLTNVTFSGNSAADYGGGMYSRYNYPTIRNAIFWGNSALSGAQIDGDIPTLSDSVVQGGYAGGTNIIISDPKLGTLGNYGGYTQTIPLLAGSSAIDTGNDATCPATDQRGVTRPQGPHCDIGAYEQDDLTAPTMNTFTVTTPSNSLDIPITSLSATDNIAVTGYLITTSSTPPELGAIDWTVTAPSTYTVVSDGSYTLYPWAKDAAGHVSALFASPRAVVVDTIAPIVNSITRFNPSPTNLASVGFTVTFSEAVTGVDENGFFLTTVGVSGASMTGVGGSGSVYTVTVNTGSGNGTIRLDVPASATITDLAGNPLANRPYTGGEKYAITKTYTILYVTPSGTGDCSNWANACNLQTALTGAVSCNEIWAMAGTYKPTTDPTNRTATFQLLEGVALYGGFAGTETARSQRNPTTHLTILSGDIGIVGNFSDNSYHVVTGATGATGATLDGFTITAGNANGASNPNNSGGGMYNYSSSPMLTNVTFSDNSAFSGGGMYNYSSSPMLTNIIFSGNSAAKCGGGMLNEEFSNPTLTTVTFSGNTATSSGGGMYNYWYVSSTLTNVTFSNNSANQGGGMYNYHSSSTLTDVTFSGNSASSGGGGMGNDLSSPTMTDVTFSGNSAGDLSGDGGGVDNILSNPTLTNVTFDSNSAFSGGGMSNGYSSPTMTNVTFDSNTAVWSGGGMSNGYDSNPTLADVTFSGNSVTFNGNSTGDFSMFGGGMSNRGSPALTNVTFSGNSVTFSGNSAGGFSGDGGGMYNGSGNPQIRNTIFWGNTALSSGAQIYIWSGTPSVSDSVVQGGYAGGTNIITTDPKLGTLGNYGGFTQTIPLLAGSSAIDTGNDTICPATDQRGVTRPQSTHCDIGAYEYYIDTTAPTVNTFTVITPSNSLNIPIAAFSATDNVAVTGYLITTSSTPPAAGAAGWTGTAPATYTVASDGSYTLYPWAKDATGNVSAVFASPRVVVVDTTAPDTQIDSHPANPSDSANASFTFSSADSTATFECSLEGGAYAACTSPKDYTGLGAGSHTFAVRTKDPAGNLDATPASYTWGIDLTTPTVVSSLRANTSPTNAAIVDFTLTFSEDVTGVAASDFALTITGTISGVSVTGVSGGPIIYTVSVNTGSGNGTITLDVPVSAIITDLAGNPLVSLPYTGGETYTVTKVFTIFLPLILH